jgi:non-reducing end alpha-L-arabinofuranosidase
MKEIRFALSVSLTVCLGIGLASCWHFSADSPGSGGSPADGGGSGGSGATGATGGTTGPSPGGSDAIGTGGSVSSAGTPCDIFGSTGNPCVAAHSTARVVYPGYSGPLYQVCKGTFTAGPNSCMSGVTMDIGSVGGYADAASQDTFCTGSTCSISIIYDQSPMKNDLKPAPAGGLKVTPDNPAIATALKTTLNGHPVYGVFIKVGTGYRAGCTGCGVVTPQGTATGDQPETMYMVTTQTGLVNGCCFDYGNAETDSHDDGNGTMEAVYFGGGVVWGTGSPGGHANGPWAMADLENGLYAGWENNSDQAISTNTPLKHAFVTAVLVGDTAEKNSGKGRFALYGGDATSGPLTTLYDGVRPAKLGYNPMQKQGSIILGTGGDNSNGGGGQWFEGVMASGAARVATVTALQENIVAAGYGK